MPSSPAARGPLFFLAMSTPRKDDRVSLARHHYLHSPFGRAADSNYEFDLDTSHFPTPSKQNGSRPRHSYRTGTLAGAYRAVSRTSMSDDGAPMGSTSSPRRTRESVIQRSPLSDASNPPEELLDVYKRIEEDGTLADFVPSYDDWDAQIGSRPGSRLSRASSRARERDHDAGSPDGHPFSEGSFLDGSVDHSPRTARRTTDYTRDEQRLRRVTGKDSPVFSKARVGSRAALTADNLQRREELEKELEEHKQPVSEDDGERGPSLNLPRTWGSRAARRQDWLRNVSGSTASESQEKRGEKEEISHAPTSRVRAEDSTTSRSVRPSRSAERSRIPVRDALGERNANPHVQETQETRTEKTSGLDQNAPPSEGAAIPNTPIVVFKNSSSTGPSTTNRDSQELLRKLSRTESPKLDSVKTPDPPKLFERKIYDKTPRVTGAWIDTPMTERVTELPSDLTKDIVPPPAPPKEAEESTNETKPPADVHPKNEGVVPVQITAKESLPESPPTQRPRPPLVRPKLPKSALETVIEDVKSGKETLDVGDDTMESLHALMDDPADLKTEEEEEEDYTRDILKRLKLASTKDQSPVDLDRLGEKLQSLQRNINAVKKGLNSLEEHVVRDLSRPGSPRKDGLLEPQSGVLATRSDDRLYAAIPLPRLWKRNPVSRRLQLTRLGWFTFVSLTWYVIECVMCEEYCHPIISETCEGYCLRPDAPVFPWVTVTMLWRWSHLSTLVTPIITIGVAFFRLMAQLLGLWDGYVDEGPSTQLGNIMGEIRINGTLVSFPWLSPPPAKNTVPPPQQPVWTPRNEAPSRWEEDQASMDEDEYL